MRKRSLSIIFVVVALLFSAWSNVIAAAFCPRFALNRDCIEHPAHQSKAVDRQSLCHHEMAGMEMNDMQTESEADSARDTSAQNSQVELTSDLASEQVALDLPIEPCAHCLSHSQPTSGSVSVARIDPSKRLVETNSPLISFLIALPAAFAGAVVPSEHGPPGNSFPRHVLINVFRI